MNDALIYLTLTGVAVFGGLGLVHLLDCIVRPGITKHNRRKN